MKKLGVIITDCETTHASVLNKDKFLQVEMKNRQLRFRGAVKAGLSLEFIGECTDLSPSEVQEIIDAEIAP